MHLCDATIQFPKKNHLNVTFNLTLTCCFRRFCVCVFERESECVCVCERERERKRASEREKESVRRKERGKK